LDGLSPGAYRCGQVWGIRIEVAGVSLYHQGSANLDDRELRRDPVDVFLAGVAGREVTPRYWERILPRLDPRVLVPTHYDNFFSPLGRPQEFVRRVHPPALPGAGAPPRRGGARGGCRPRAAPARGGRGGPPRPPGTRGGRPGRGPGSRVSPSAPR